MRARVCDIGLREVGIASDCPRCATLYICISGMNSMQPYQNHATSAAHDTIYCLVSV